MLGGSTMERTPRYLACPYGPTEPMVLQVIGRGYMGRVIGTAEDKIGIHMPWA